MGDAAFKKELQNAMRDYWLHRDDEKAFDCKKYNVQMLQHTSSPLNQFGVHLKASDEYGLVEIFWDSKSYKDYDSYYRSNSNFSDYHALNV